MCFYSKQSKTAVELQHRFKAKFANASDYQATTVNNGFLHPKTPVITNKDSELIQLYNWGLIPHWAKDVTIRKNTLNARMETINQKPSFRDAAKNRCLVLVDGFYEWQWLDDKGKKKQKYLITLPDDEAFAFGGIYNDWVDKSTGEVINTYTILTTDANYFMSIIHNSQKRMPLILNKDTEKDWLNGLAVEQRDIELIATPV